MSVEVTVSRPVALLLHGAGQHAGVWEAVRARLEGTLAPSLPGRLDAPGPPLPDIEAMATWALGEVPAGSAFVLVGHSMGGAVALELALRRPQGLVGLVLVSTGARLRVHPAILAASEQAVDAGTPLSMGALGLPPGAPSALFEAVEALERAVPPGTALADWRATHSFDHMARLGEIAVPTRVLVGGSDALTPPKYAAHLAEAVSAATLQVVDGAGHLLPLERPDVVADAVGRLRGEVG